MTEPKTYALEVPGAVLHYDVRAGDGSTWPVLLIIGSPMGASGFGALAGRFADRTVVTYDPRGAERSTRTDGAVEATVDEHADDLHRLICVLGAGPVGIFAGSGGAVNALALVARHPEQVRILVAHEPPAVQALPGRERALAANTDIRQMYQRSGFGPAMAKFLTLVSLPGPVPDDYADRPAPDPAAFGLPAQDDGSRDDALLGLNMISLSQYRHDFTALRAVPARIVVGAGAQSGQALAGRGAVAVAGRLGTAPVTFPGGHGGFLPSGGPYGGEPDTFAGTLRTVLSG
jgi:pimeloyl-ACP methyl ester carboxylesterase